MNVVVEFRQKQAIFYSVVVVGRRLSLCVK